MLVSTFLRTLMRTGQHAGDAIPAEVQVTRKQLKALHKDGLLSKVKTGNSDLFSYRGG